MGRRGRPGSQSSGADSAGPGRTPDVATPAPGAQLLQREAPRSKCGCSPREDCSRELLSPERMAGAHRTNLRALGVRAAAAGERQCGCGVQSGLGDAASFPAKRGSAGLGGARCVARAPVLSRAIGSALLLLAGSRTEGGPSYPDVRSPGLNGGGGEAARAAFTRETAPSCHQPSVLLSGGVPGGDGKGAIPPGGAWEPQVGAAGTALSRRSRRTRRRSLSRASH